MYLSEQSEVEAYLEFCHNKLLKFQLTLHIKMTILHRSAPKILKSLHVFFKIKFIQCVLHNLLYIF